jgi:hypothetical protein
MGRFNDDYDDEDFNNQAALYQANTDRALRGKRGQVFLREMEEALLMLPKKELINGAVCREGQVCAIGALALKRKRDAGDSISAALYWLEKEAPDEWSEADSTAAYASEHLDVLERLAYRMAWINDRYEPEEETSEKRYERVLKWVREHRKAPVAK